MSSNTSEANLPAYPPVPRLLYTSYPLNVPSASLPALGWLGGAGMYGARGGGLGLGYENRGGGGGGGRGGGGEGGGGEGEVSGGALPIWASFLSMW